MLARVVVHASLHPAAFAARLVDVADREAHVRYVTRNRGVVWTPGVELTRTKGMRPSVFIAEHQAVLNDVDIRGVGYLERGTVGQLWVLVDF
jgi:hypothetical protein